MGVTNHRARMDNYVFFYKNEFSNFHPAPYTRNSIRFRTSEQGFMYDKAMYFGDAEIAKEILLAKTPWEAKKLGRKVRGFDEYKWSQQREECMYNNCYAKFNQNEHLKRLLLGTAGKRLVEASSRDKIWGIGHNMNFAPHSNPRYWGLNLLGKTLDKVRDQLDSQ